MKPRQVYLLAGGDGKRAGGPKAWREHEGEPLLKRHVDFLVSRFEESQVAASMQLPWADRCRALSESVCWVPGRPADPPMAAIQALIKTQPMRDWSFFYHVDQPVWEPELFDALESAIDEAQKAGDEAIVPVLNGKGGHPVVLSPSLQEPLLELDPSEGRLDQFLHTKKVRRLEVSFQCILENWNGGEEGG